MPESRVVALSSVSYRVGADDEQTAATHTTPEAPDLQVAPSSRWSTSGSRACVMEVSSHALALHRVDEIGFDAVVFTNLTRDHLDFHGDMSSYFAAKRKLFSTLSHTSPAILNVDDKYGQLLAKDASRPVTYAITSPADVRPERLDLSLTGLEIDVRTPRGTLHIRSRLLGRYNAYNLLGAAATGAALSLPFRAIESGLASVESVPGRMEVVSGSDDDIGVVVDFAHTDDALKSLLDAVKPLARGRVITVFGCGGDRDRTKRPLMGTVASRLSDMVVLTSDNPRSEDPAAIAQDIEAGLAAGETTWVTVLDREEAITRALVEARPGDLVVLAGKGRSISPAVSGVCWSAAKLSNDSVSSPPSRSWTSRSRASSASKSNRSCPPGSIRPSPCRNKSCRPSTMTESWARGRSISGTKRDNSASFFSIAAGDAPAASNWANRRAVATS